MLRNLQIRLSYRTGRDDLVEDFFVPCLERATLYRRSAGYFTSAGLALAARGVASLASRGGRMQLVVSPHLEPDDVAALQRAIETPVDVLRSITARTLEEIEDALIENRLNALAWLSAAGLLEVKLALRLNRDGQIHRGIYHEKAGIFSDDAGDHVAFSGSANETAGGLIENFESLDVFRSWQDPEERVSGKIADFEALWEDETPGVKVIAFTEASRELLERFRDPDSPPRGLPWTRLNEPRSRPFRPPAGFELRDYQADAIRAWSQAGGKGILAMATGTGKTFTALTLASKVAEKNESKGPMVLIVVCPFINLCRQWAREMGAFGLTPVTCFEGRHRWEALLEEGYQRISAGMDPVLAIVTTNATFQTEAFQARIRARLDHGNPYHLIIADEVHNLGAANVQSMLPEGIRLRLGLSATPERYLDPVGTQALLDYFGNVVFEYSLAQAIAEGRLCPYRYYPILVSLTDEEAEEYADITAKLGRLLGGNDEIGELGAPAMHLLMRRARLLGSAQNKLTALDELIAGMPEKPSKAIFYCGDGRTNDTISEEEIQQVRAVARLLGEKHGLRVRTFTFRESPAEREEILRDLASGFLDGVVAIRCLDEGIDLPDLRMGFLLASSTNPRQLVQRRGRLLRPSHTKTNATIRDFIIQPPQFNDDVYRVERACFAREMERIAAFCRAAQNGPEALKKLQDLRSKYNFIGTI